MQIRPKCDLLVACSLVRETTLLFDALPGDEAIERDGVDALRGRALKVVEDGGGSAANTAVAAAQSGLRVVAVCRGGDDPDGRFALARLAGAGVDVVPSLLAGRTTKRNVVLKEAGSDRGTFRTTVPERVAPPLAAGDVPDGLLTGARVLHLDRASEAGLAWAARRWAEGLPVSLDLHTHPWRGEARTRLDALLGLLDVVQVRGEAAERLGAWRGWGQAAVAVAERLAGIVRWVAVTLGAQGAIACERGGRPFHVPAVPVLGGVVDSTGAGDAFAAELLRGRLAGVSIEAAVRSASGAGARSCGWAGPRRPSSGPGHASGARPR